MENVINEAAQKNNYLNKKRNNEYLLKNINLISSQKKIINNLKGINKIRHNDLIKLIIDFLNLSELCSLIYYLGHNKLSIIINEKIKSFFNDNLSFIKIKESNLSNYITISNYSTKNLINEFFGHLKIKELRNKNIKYFYYDSEYEK